MTTSSAPWKGLDWVLGLSVRLKTVAGEEVDGRIYSYDPVTNCVALECPRKPPTSAHHPKHDFRIFKINFIKEISVVPSSPPPQVPAPAQPASNGGDAETPNAGPFATTVPVVGFVQVERLQAREAQTLKEATQQLARIGVGVTTEGQDIFDALSKTLPCRWHKESIIVLDDVLISPPYEIENCQANSSSAASLAQVKKVLEGEKRRLASARKQ